MSLPHLSLPKINYEIEPDGDAFKMKVSVGAGVVIVIGVPHLPTKLSEWRKVRKLAMHHAGEMYAMLSGLCLARSQGPKVAHSMAIKAMNMPDGHDGPKILH